MRTLESPRRPCGRWMTLLLATLVLVWVPCLVLTACDPNIDESGIDVDASGDVSDEEQVTRRVEALFDTLHDPTDETLDAYIAKLSNEQRLAIDVIRLNGVDITDLCSRLFSDVSYEVGDVTLKDDAATVAVTFSHKPFGALANETNQQFGELLQSDEGSQLMGQGIPALLNRYESLYLENLDASRDSVTNDLSVQLERRNGSWAITEDSIQVIAATLVEGVDLQYGG